jgi:hypothetical protein
LVQIESARVNVDYVLAAQRAAHDEALAIFRRHVTAELRDAYDTATEAFRTVRKNAQPAFLSYLQLRVGQNPSGSTEEEVLAAIEAILAFAS